MRMRVPVLVGLLLVAQASPRERATACPRLELKLADLVEDATTIVLAEVVAVHDVAGEPVAEARVLDLLKGDATSETLFHPVRYWDPEDGPKAGERTLLLLKTDAEISGTRAFWKAVDRLRAGRPLLDLAFIGRIPLRRLDDGSEAFLLRFGGSPRGQPSRRRLAAAPQGGQGMSVRHLPPAGGDPASGLTPGEVRRCGASAPQ